MNATRLFFVLAIVCSPNAFGQIEIINVEDNFWCFSSAPTNERACLKSENYTLWSVSGNTVSFESRSKRKLPTVYVDLDVPDSKKVPAIDLPKDFEFELSKLTITGTAVDVWETKIRRDTVVPSSFDFFWLRYHTRGAVFTLTGDNLEKLENLARKLLCFFPRESGFYEIDGIVRLKDDIIPVDWEARIENCEIQ